jgi:hypothetical protein
MDNEFPKWKYGPDERAELVHSTEQEEALGEGWFDTPWEAKGEVPKPAIPVGKVPRFGVGLEPHTGTVENREPVFLEYPKWIDGIDGKPVIANSAEHEAEIIAAAEAYKEAQTTATAKRGPGRPPKVVEPPADDPPKDTAN